MAGSSADDAQGRTPGRVPSPGGGFGGQLVQGGGQVGEHLPEGDPEHGLPSTHEVDDLFVGGTCVYPDPVVDRVERQHDRVTVTRDGHAAAVILSSEDLAQLEETLDVLSDPDALADIREADAAYRDDDVVRGVGAVRALRP